jgi:glycine dehydrogenase subunit 2
MGVEGLSRIGPDAVLAANYVRARLEETYAVAYDVPSMHEVVLTDKNQKERGVTTLDIAKRLIDYGFHPPTVYFPLIVPEAMMIEPTESEPLEMLDAFVGAMLEIDRESREEPETVRSAPHRAPARRFDEATAARKPVLRYRREG